MSNEKKLKRGLNDVSPQYFSPSEAVPHPPNQDISGMVTSAILAPRSLAEDAVRCMSIFPFRSSNELLYNPRFNAELRKIFGNLCLVAIGKDQSCPPLNQCSSIRHVTLSEDQIQAALHLQPAITIDLSPSSERHGNLGIFLDPISIFEHEKNLLQILDYAVLHVKTDSPESLVSAYQSFRVCLEWNPSLHFLLLVDGKASERISELVYEKFTRIASKFMSHEISFMGWMDGNDLRLNEDIFLDGPEVSSLWSPSKKILARVLRENLLHHSL